MSELPDILLPYQQEAVTLAGEHPLLVIEKSRRIGLSYAFSPYATLAAAAASHPSNVYYIGYNLDMAREFIGYCADFTKAFDGVKVSLPPQDAVLEPYSKTEIGPGRTVESGNVAVDQAEGTFLFQDGSTKGIKTLRIDYPSGKAVAALPSSARSVRGKQGIFIIDEAAFHDDLDELIKAVLAALMWGGSVIVISTHDGVENPFNALIEDIRAGRRAGHVLRITLRDAIEAGLYKRICLVQGKPWSKEAEEAWEANLRKTYGDAADEELDVIPARGSGAYMPRAMIEACCSAEYPVLRLACPPGFEVHDLEWRNDWAREWLETEVMPVLRRFDPEAYSFFGQDFARSSDLSVIAFGQFNELAVLTCRLIIEMRNMPFRQQKLVLDWILERVPLFSAGKMDARGNGQQLAEDMVDDWGADRIEAIMATPKTYLAMMPRLKGRIEDQLIVIPRSEGVIEDLRLVKLVNGIPQIVDRADDREDGSKNRRHGDAAIALMHLVAASDADFGPMEFFSTGARASAAYAGTTAASLSGLTTGPRTFDDDYSL